MDAPLPPERSASRLKRFAPAAAVLAGLAFGYMMGWHEFLSLDYLSRSEAMLRGQVAAHPVLAPVVFFGLYAATVAFSFPAASVLTVFGGFLFGWLKGGLVVALAATLGASLLFLAARSAFGDVLRRRAGGAAKALAEGFERDAFNYLLVLRLAPVFPFFIINIVPALFNVRLATFAGATLIGILPGTFAYAFLGQGVGSALAAARAAGTTLRLSDIVTPELAGAFFALAGLALVPVIIKKLRPRA